MESKKALEELAEEIKYTHNDGISLTPYDSVRIKTIKQDLERLEKYEKLKIFIYKEKEKIDKQIKELNPDYNESITDCEECEMWSRLFSRKKLLEEIIKEVFENE